MRYDDASALDSAYVTVLRCLTTLGQKLMSSCSFRGHSRPFKVKATLLEASAVLFDPSKSKGKIRAGSVEVADVLTQGHMKYKPFSRAELHLLSWHSNRFLLRIVASKQLSGTKK